MVRLLELVPTKKAALVLFAFLSSRISPAYFAFGILALAWVVSLMREKRWPLRG